MKYSFILFLSFIIVSQSADCFGEDCAYKSPIVEIENPTISDLVPGINKEIRRAYWYFLEDANMLYQGNVDSPTRFLFFFIYRNIVGTFLTIASWDKTTRVSEINTMVRLGNGYSKQHKTNYEPANIQPFVISVNIGEDESVLALSESGELKVDGKIISNDGGEEEESDNKCLNDADYYLRKRFWYFIRGADLVSSDSIQTNIRTYLLLTYVNIVGTFFVITSCEDGDIINVNTFVRLGAGGRPSHKLEANQIKKGE